ncbi:Vitelline membrane outer layer protein 1 [Caenorhabditis elegans]|uniref:Vitelline membrane outer layer protein 1 n=1 Tax=Caenorhabditis elegans TaxID=6239 RepID=G5EBG1_CAEEL|nr:Vitelline membrane outer layer protein 1 [Caenorhabditis elegans]CAB16498.1 Vitelline membrane outer layer protein 1 [Caenorhabditis elegans]|eukprot:NP_502758.1 Uncharacterized protein CELE_Y57G11A.2 [Caenorhabditis elegans]
MLHPSIVWMVFGVWTLGVKSQVIVQSPNISTFGTWQPWARCPEGQYANGMRIKFEEWSEDVEIAGLTAVDLRCAAKGGPHSEESVISGESVSGTWQNVQYCPDDKVIVGFSLKVEELQGNYDDAGALNFAAFCGAQFGARNSKVVLQGDTKSVTRGHWTEDLYCPTGFAVCGIQARVEKNETQAGIDDTGVNNVQVECCPAPYDCDASYEAKEVDKYQNNNDYETSHKVLVKSKYEGPAAADKTEQEFVAKKIMLSLKKKYEQLEFSTAPADFVYTRNKRQDTDPDYVDGGLVLGEDDPEKTSVAPEVESVDSNGEDLAASSNGEISEIPTVDPTTSGENSESDPVFEVVDPSSAPPAVANADENAWSQQVEQGSSEAPVEMTATEDTAEETNNESEVEASTEAPFEVAATEDSNQAPVDPIFTEAPAEGSQEEQTSDGPVFIPEDGSVHSTEAPFEVAATEVSEVTHGSGSGPMPEQTDEVPGPWEPVPSPVPEPEDPVPRPELATTTEGLPVQEPEDPNPIPEDTVPGPEDTTPGPAVTEEIPEVPEPTEEPPTPTDSEIDSPTPAPAPGPEPESPSNYHRLSISMDELEVLVQQAVAGQNMVITLPVPAHKKLIVEQIVVKCDEHVISLPALIVKHR